MTHTMTETETNYGTLNISRTGEAVRPATAAELYESLCAGDTGAIIVDGETCYVEGGSYESLIDGSCGHLGTVDEIVHAVSIS